MRQEAEAFGTANRPDLFNMLDMYFRELRLGEICLIIGPSFVRVNKASVVTKKTRPRNYY
jgi:hypothetical protein